MYPNQEKDPTFVALVFVQVDPKYYELKQSKRKELTKPHIEELGLFLEKCSLTSLKGSGLSSDLMIELIESEDLNTIEKMIDVYKAGAKASYGSIEKVIVTRKGMELPRGTKDFWKSKA